MHAFFSYLPHSLALNKPLVSPSYTAETFLLNEENIDRYMEKCVGPQRYKIFTHYKTYLDRIPAGVKQQHLALPSRTPKSFYPFLPSGYFVMQGEKQRNSCRDFVGFLTARAAPLIVSGRVFMTEITESSIVRTLTRRNSVFKIEI